MTNTKVLTDEYKGNPVLKVLRVDDDGEPAEGHYPVISFGLVKAKAIIKHIDDIKKFVEENK